MRSKFEFLWIAIPLAIFLGVPVLLVWGWIRWLKDKNPPSILPTLSLVSFLLTSLSALVAFLTYLCVRFFGSSPLDNPTLAELYAWGAGLPLEGFCLR